MRSWWPDGTYRQTTTPVRVLIVNEGRSPFGVGWSVAGFQRLHIQSDGILVTEGDGSAAFFAKACSTCAYQAPRGDFSTLTYDGTQYIRRSPDGTRAVFFTDGRAGYVEDRFGNRTTFYYVGAGYAGAGNLMQIHDPAYALHFTYASTGKLASIDIGPASDGRRVLFTHDAAGQLTHIRDPDGVYALQAEYVRPHRMSYWIDRRGGRRDFAYDPMTYKLATHTLPQIVAEGASVRPAVQFRAPETAVMPRRTDIGTSSNPAPRVVPDSAYGRVTNPRGHATRLWTDRFGAPTRMEEPLGRVTRWVRDDSARVTRVVAPSGDSTSYTWSRSNLTQTLNHTTGRTVSMAYEGTYNRLTTLSGDAVYRRNFYTGVRLDSTKVGSSTAKATTYTSDARGRPLTITDPGNHRTTFFYASSGWMNTDSVKSGAVGSSKLRRTVYQYDGSGRLNWVRDPEGNVTRTAYDLLNRTQRTIGAIGDTITGTTRST